MFRFFSAAAFFISIVATMPAAAPVPPTPPEYTKDRDGNPLPKGAVARLGWTPFRSYLATFTSDSKKLVSVENTKVLGWDAATARPLPRDLLPPPLEPKLHVHFCYGEMAGEYAIRWLWKPREGRPAGAPLITDPYIFVSRLSDGKTVSWIPCGHVNYPRGSNEYWGSWWSENNVATADGKTLAMMIDHPTNSDKACAIGIFDLDTGKLLQWFPLPDRNPASFVLSPNGKMLFLMEIGKQVKCFDAISGKEMPPLEDSKAVGRIEVSPDGKQLVTWEATSNEAHRYPSTAYRNEHLSLYEVATGKRTGRLDLGGRPVSFRFAGPNSIVVLTGSLRREHQADCSLSRWKVSTQQREWKVSVPASDTLTVAPDGKRLVLFHSLTSSGRPYNAETGEPGAPPGHNGPVDWVGWSADGETVVTAGTGQLFNWTAKGDVKSVHTSNDLRLRLRDSQTHGEKLTWSSQNEGQRSYELIGWNHTKNEVAWRIPVTDYTVSETFSHDGNVVIGVGWDQKEQAWGVRRFDGQTGKTTVLSKSAPIEREDHDHFPLPMVLSGDGTVFCMAGDDVLGIETKTGKELFRVKCDNSDSSKLDSCYPIAASPNGKRIAMVRRKPGPVVRGLPRGREFFLRVLDADSGKTLAEQPLDPLQTVTYRLSLQFSPNGKYLVISNRGSVLICNAESSETPPKKFEPISSSNVSCIGFSPNSANLAVGYEDGTTIIWDLNANVTP